MLLIMILDALVASKAVFLSLFFYSFYNEKERLNHLLAVSELMMNQEVGMNLFVLTEQLS